MAGHEHAAPRPIFDVLFEAPGLAPTPTLVIVTRSGNLGPPRSYLDGPLIVTSLDALDRLGPHAEAGAELVAPGSEGTIDPRVIVGLLRDRGCPRVLTEGGPGL